MQEAEVRKVQTFKDMGSTVQNNRKCGEELKGREHREVEWLDLSVVEEKQ